MKLIWAERLAVNNPLRPLQQRLEMNWYYRRVKLEAEARILEIGCGRGAGAILIKDTAPKAVYRAPRSECMPITSDDIKKI